MNAGPILATEGRLKIAEMIAQMSDQVLSIHDNRHSGYFALKIGAGPNSNVATVRTDKDRVSFFISSTDVLSRATALFNPVPAESTRPCDKDKYRFKLSLADLQNNESLFREIVNESVRTIRYRRPQKNPNRLRSHTMPSKDSRG